MARPLHFDGSNELVQHLTWSTKDRVPVFENREIAQVCLAAFDSERLRLKIEIFAYVLMPDHNHMIVGPSIVPTGTVVQWMKLASSCWLKREGLLDKSPWQVGYFDRAIESESQLRAAVEYLHGNPVRAGLVENLGDYQYSSWGFYEGCGKSRIRVTAAPL